MRATDIGVGDGGGVWRSLDRLGFKVVLEDGGDGFERAGIERQCPGAGRIQPFRTTAALQFEDADTGTDALFRPWPIALLERPAQMCWQGLP